MARTPLRITVFEILFAVLLVNCPHGIVGQERDLFEYEDFTTEIDLFQAREGDFTARAKKKGPRLPSSKPFLQVAQGRHMLFFIPGVKHCDLVAFQLWDAVLLEWHDMGCSEADSIGWMWTFDCVPDKLNKYRVFGRLNFHPILIGEIVALAGHKCNFIICARLLEFSGKYSYSNYRSTCGGGNRPPPILSHAVSSGPGWVLIWARLPEEDYPSILGIKVRFTEQSLEGGKWVSKVAPFNETSIYTNKRYFQRVQYGGDKAMIWPIHECPQWPKSKMFCMLFTDKFAYTETFTKPQRKDLTTLKGWGTQKMPPTPSYVDNKKKIFFMMETFRIPLYYPMSVHGDKYNVVITPYNCDPLENCPSMSGHIPSTSELDVQLDELLSGPMFEEEHPTAPRKRPKRRPWPRETQLWVIFIVLSLFILAVILPIIFYFATRAGFRAADDMWTSWAEAPGNIIVGMGYTTVAWQGEQPAWKYERRGQ